MSDARDVFLPVAAQPTVDHLVSLSQRAESLGYARVWLPETWGRDAVTTLTSIAERTEDVGIGTSIANVYSRSPALLGQTAATLQGVSDGRFRLGLGPSGPLVVEGWHGVPYERPLRRTREAIDVVRTVLAGDRVEYDGEVFDLSGFRLRCEPPDPPPAVDAAGLGSTAVELAGRFADGWHALLLTRDGVRDRLDDFERGVALGDRDRCEQRVTLSVPCCTLADRERARTLTRRHVAFYVGGMGTFYRDALASQGYEDTARAVAKQWANGERAAAAASIDDGLLDEIAVAGTPDECAERLASPRSRRSTASTRCRSRSLGARTRTRSLRPRNRSGQSESEQPTSVGASNAKPWESPPTTTTTSSAVASVAASSTPRRRFTTTS